MPTTLRSFFQNSVRKNIFLVLTGILFSGCAGIPSTSTTITIPNHYSGVDAGQVIVSLGAVGIFPGRGSYQFFFRPIGHASTATPELGFFEFRGMNGFLMAPPLSKNYGYEIKGEWGTVVSAMLPPGEYEIFNFSINMPEINGNTTFSSRLPFSIPFVVRSREVIYLGNYQTKLIVSNGFIKRVNGVTLGVASRLQNDVMIVRNGDSTLNPDVIDMTPSVDEINSAIFISQ